MRHYKNLVKVGGTIVGASSLILLYNFFEMYSLAGKCPNDIDVKPCQAYDNWALLNTVGLIVLGAGLVILVVGLLKRNQNKS